MVNYYGKLRTTLSLSFVFENSKEDENPQQLDSATIVKELM
jgi:hypothetical protein